MLSRLCRSLVLQPDKQMAKFTARVLCSKAPSYDEIPLQTTERDDYFAAVQHVSNIVRHDFYMERTLNKMRLSLTSDLVFRVIRASSRFGTEAFRFFNWARAHQPASYTPTSVEYEEMVKILARSKKYESMWKVIHEMKNQNLGLSADAVCGIIEEFGRQGLTDQAVEVFNKSKNFDCAQTVKVYNSLLFALCEVKMFHAAYALIGRMVRKKVVPDKRTYAVLVNGWCSSGKMREAQEFLEDMSRKGFNPPIRGRDLLIEGLLNAGYLESAKDMVKKMTKEGFVPDIDTFNSLMEAVSKSGEVDFCLSLHYKACELGLCPDINTYKLLIPPVSKAGLIEEAFKLLNNSVEVGHRPFPSLYAPIIKGMCRRGQFDEAFSFFSEMKMKGHPPNRPVYTMLITMCGRGGRYVDAANYLVEMTEFGFVPISRCFDMVTDGLKNIGKHDLAKRMEQLEMSDDNPYEIPEMDPTLRKQIQECNWQVVNVTTPANYFHVLRRQIHREFLKPLIVISPKNLLRHKDCKSNLSEFDDVQWHPGFDKQGTRFKRLIKDQNNHSDLEVGIRRLVLCSGKVYYKLDEERKKAEAKDIAIRLVEQLCPFPYDLIRRELKRYLNAEVVWCQEEPMNMGAYNYILPRLAGSMKALGRGTFEDINYAGRAPSATTATGFYQIHVKEQSELVQMALQHEPMRYPF